ncbi:unnamed protein product [Knipowitschia caucasica]|uniref:Uncharacterized protein n=1 Tax=Knipowitschia caucasica TaxID=637954 RepID=A0AAV2JF76_KNICA
MHPLLSREKKEEEDEEEVGFGVGFLPHAATMFSCVGCFWVLLSSALVAVCSFSFISPAWIVKEQLRTNPPPQHQGHSKKDSVSFGLLWHCSESLDHMYRCYTFGGLGKFAEIPSSSWQVLNLNTVYTLRHVCMDVRLPHTNNLCCQFLFINSCLALAEEVKC